MRANVSPRPLLAEMPYNGFVTAVSGTGQKGILALLPSLVQATGTQGIFLACSRTLY